ncbi:MAG: transglycosylase domain-containing protein [Alphaproteobacteria bacterium]
MFVFFAILWFCYDLPDFESLTSPTRKPSVTIQTFDGTVLGTYGDAHEDVVNVRDLPSYVPQALIAVEDKRFYSHFGIDFIGLIRAFYANYIAGRVVQGGSTVTQQLAKNLLVSQGHFVFSDKSIKRKIQEVILALWLEWRFKKDQILTIYLNRVYFGSGTYGIDAAARKYFDKSARNLSVFEAAVIAGLLKAPSYLSPYKHPESAKIRAEIVLKLMEDSGFLNNYQFYMAQADEDLSISNRAKELGSRYFADWVFENIPQIVGNIDRDIIVITTLDIAMQRHAEQICAEQLLEHGNEFKVSQVAFLAMTPRGAVKAMVGGKDYSKSQFNRVTQALRQPGSAFKIFVFLAALEDGMTTETLVDDSVFSTNKWKPRNFFWQSQGMITLKKGFSRSVNSVSIRLTQKVTPNNVIKIARSLGITRSLNNDLSLALGTGETTLFEMTTAVATFANEGRSVWPYAVLEIRDKKGNILYHHKKFEGKKIISQEVLQNMRELLREAICNGYGRAANVDQTVSGKTGSNANKDAWFFGYRENTENTKYDFLPVVVGTWVGNDKGEPMFRKSVGGRIPTWIAAKFLKDPGGKITKTANYNKPTAVISSDLEQLLEKIL